MFQPKDQEQREGDILSQRIAHIYRVRGDTRPTPPLRGRGITPPPSLSDDATRGRGTTSSVLPRGRALRGRGIAAAIHGIEQNELSSRSMPEITAPNSSLSPAVTPIQPVAPHQGRGNGQRIKELRKSLIPRPDGKGFMMAPTTTTDLASDLSQDSLSTAIADTSSTVPSSLPTRASPPISTIPAQLPPIEEFTPISLAPSAEETVLEIDALFVRHIEDAYNNYTEHVDNPRQHIRFIDENEVTEFIHSHGEKGKTRANEFCVQPIKQARIFEVRTLSNFLERSDVSYGPYSFTAYLYDKLIELCAGHLQGGLKKQAEYSAELCPALLASLNTWALAKMNQVSMSSVNPTESMISSPIPVASAQISTLSTIPQQSSRSAAPQRPPPKPPHLSSNRHSLLAHTTAESTTSEQPTSARIYEKRQVSIPDFT